jgi:hypothetical protein
LREISVRARLSPAYRLSGGKVPIAADSLACAAASTGRCLAFVLAGSLPR